MKNEMVRFVCLEELYWIAIFYFILGGFVCCLLGLGLGLGLGLTDSDSDLVGRRLVWRHPRTSMRHESERSGKEKRRTYGWNSGLGETFNPVCTVLVSYCESAVQNYDCPVMSRTPLLLRSYDGSVWMTPFGLAPTIFEVSVCNVIRRNFCFTLPVCMHAYLSDCLPVWLAGLLSESQVTCLPVYASTVTGNSQQY